MADLINGQKVFEELMQRSKSLNDQLRYQYQYIGEKALEGKEITNYDRELVANYKARIEEIDLCIKTMQKVLREANQ